MDLTVDAPVAYTLTTRDGRRANVELSPDQGGETVKIHLQPPPRKRRRRPKKSKDPAPLDVVIE